MKDGCHWGRATRRVAVALCLLGARVGYAQVVAGPTFDIGSPQFGVTVADVDVASGTDDSFVVIWGDYEVNNWARRRDLR
jgi:hypothetical protein